MIPGFKPNNQIKDYSATPKKENKGEYNGDCNITACDQKEAKWYNHSTRKYYCTSCARRLNRDIYNSRYAQAEFGHTLCTLGKENEK